MAGRILTFILLYLSGMPLYAGTADPREWSCDSLDSYTERIFEQDLFERQSIRVQIPELFDLMESRGCEGLPNAMNLLGIIHFNRKEPLLAKRLFLQVDSMLNVSASLSRAYIRSQLWLGLTDLQENRHESANLFFEKSLRLSQQAGFKKGILQAYINMGTANIAQGNLDQAESVLIKALEINQELGNELWIGYAYLNLGRIYSSRGEVDQALAYTRRSEEIWQALAFPKGLYYSHLSLAGINQAQQKPEQRAEHLKQALEYARRDSTINPHNTYVAIGYHYFESGDTEQAKFYFEKAVKNSQAITDQQLTDLAKILLELYAAEGDITKIQQFNTNLLEIYRSRAELAKVEAMKWQAREETLENQISENSNLREIQLANELKLQQRNFLLLFAGILVILVLVVAYIQYRAGAQKKALLEKIQSQNEELTGINQQLVDQKARIEDQNKKILEAQDQLIVQEKMASLGQLTAGIAHEIKNPLNFIINFAEGSREIADELTELLGNNDSAGLSPEINEEGRELARELHQNAADIEKSGRKIDRIVHSMMDHARDTEDNWQSVDLNELLDENANLAYHSYRANDSIFNVQFERAYDDSLPKIEALPLHVGRVILNILNNACYAVNQKQKHSDSSYRPVIRLQTRKLDDHVEVHIWDNGPGIPEEVQKDMFTPFFTTKPTGSGNTGLGLSISYDIIVKEHRGQLEVNTEPGAFTEFRIVLPLAGNGHSA